MKQFTSFLAVLLTAMSLSAQTTYKKVTSAPADWTGTYLIICEDQGVVFNGGASEDNIDAKGGPAILSGFTFDGSDITGTAALDTATFTISASGDESWPWAIQSHSGLYIGHKDSVVADNGLSAEWVLVDKCKQRLTIDENGNLIATPRYELGGEYNLQYNKKSDQLRFRYFVPADKKAVQLYKLQEATPLESVSVQNHVIKLIENGQLIFIKNGIRYNSLGQRL